MGQLPSCEAEARHWILCMLVLFSYGCFILPLFFFFRCFSLLQTEVTLLKRLQSTKTFCRAVPAITGSFFWLVLRHFCNKLHHCTSFLNFLFILNPDVIFSLTWTKSRTLGTQLMKKNKSYEAIQVCEGTCCAPLQDPSLF